MRWCALVLLMLGLIAGAGCSDDEGGAASSTAGGSQAARPSSDGAEQRFPDVITAEAMSRGDAFDFEVTISSPYDTPERYADGWRILGPGARVLGQMTLGHDHASEQPFTRSQSGVRIPPGVRRVTVEGHDRANGYGGTTRMVALPGR